MARTTDRRKPAAAPQRPATITPHLWRSWSPARQRSYLRITARIDELPADSRLWPGCKHLQRLDDAGVLPPAPTRACFPLSETDRLRHTPELIFHGLSREQCRRLESAVFALFEQAQEDARLQDRIAIYGKRALATAVA